jgi:hypothetical protein
MGASKEDHARHLPLPSTSFLEKIKIEKKRRKYTKY